MNNQDWTIENVEIRELSLWDENARFPDKYFSKTEEELINYFLSQPKFQIFEFAKEVVEEFDLPQMEKIIVYDNGDKKIVIEGNRRLMAYKLLANPNLIKDINLKSRFQKLKSKITIGEEFELECLVTEDLDEGYRYVERKHLKKNNERGWGETETNNHKSRRGKANEREKIKIAISNRIRSLSIPEKMKDDVLGFGYQSTLWRIIASTPTIDKYELKIASDNKLNTKNKDLDKILKVIIFNVLSKKDFKGGDVTSRALNTKKEIELYLNSIDERDFKEVEKILLEIDKKDKTSQGDTSQKYGAGKKSTTQTAKSKSNIRACLIPKDCKIGIKNEKINNLYYELKKIKVKDFPNLVSLSLRVFMELSMNCYRDKYGLKEISSKGKEKKMNLQEKITQVVNHLEVKIKMDKHVSKGILVEIKNKHGLFSTDTLNAYIHNQFFSPQPDNLRITWNNIQEFMIKVWENID